jgi:hypothetical protein
MRSNWVLLGVVLSAFVSTLVETPGVLAQRNTPRIALKSGESTDVRNYFYIVNCQSILIGQPTLDVLEGLDEVTVTLKEAMITPRGQNCAKPVPGGNVVVTAKQIDEPKEGKLTYRLKFNTKQGERQTSETLLVSLFP